MPNYLCVQRSLPVDEADQASPSDMQEMYSRFAAWQEKFQDQLVDLGGRLGEGKLVSSDGPPDGPFVEVKELVGGYMIVSAPTLDEAAIVAGECPGLVRPGSGVEVIEIHTG